MSFINPGRMLACYAEALFTLCVITVLVVTGPIQSTAKVNKVTLIC